MYLINSSKLLFCLTIIMFFLSSCKKEEDFYQVSPIELKIHQKINDLRVANHLNTLVFQPLLLKKARDHSKKRADRKMLTNEGLSAVINDLKNKVGGTDAGYILDKNQFAEADSIVTKILSDPETNEIIYGSFTQAGVGVSKDTDMINYITVIFLNIPK